MTGFLWLMLTVLAVLVLACVARAFRGPRNTDRVIAVNIIGSVGNAAIAIIATIYKQNFLADVAILYTMLSFTAVMVMSRIMRGVNSEMKNCSEFPVCDAEANYPAEAKEHNSL